MIWGQKLFFILFLLFLVPCRRKYPPAGGYVCKIMNAFLVPCRRKYPQRKDDHYVKTIYF